MARGFTEREKDIIRKALIDAGKEHFGKYGLKKTSIEDLTKAVGISQGSFYSFFNSKEELYLEVMNREREVIKKKLFRESENKQKLTRQDFKLFFKEVLETINTNSIIRQIFFEEEEVKTLIRKIPLKTLKEYENKFLQDFIPIINKWQKKGVIIDNYRPEVIASALQIIYYPLLHKKNSEDNYFEETLELLMDIIAKGLLTEGERKIS